jgi:hypothetical protein
MDNSICQKQKQHSRDAPALNFVCNRLNQFNANVKLYIVPVIYLSNQKSFKL